MNFTLQHFSTESGVPTNRANLFAKNYVFGHFLQRCRLSMQDHTF